MVLIIVVPLSFIIGDVSGHGLSAGLIMMIGLFDEIESHLYDENLYVNKGDIILIYYDGITETWKKEVLREREPLNTICMGKII